MSVLAQIAIAGLILVLGAVGGVRWHAGQDAIRENAARELREADARQQRRFDDQAAGRHAAELATLNSKLGDARAQIASLPGRACLDAGTVRLLNDTGVPVGGRAPAGQPAGAAAATAAAGDDRLATDRDVSSAIATCRTRYAEVSGQLNQILDIEDRRHPRPP